MFIHQTVRRNRSEFKIESELTQKNTSKSPLSIINYKNPSRNYSTLTITPSEVTVDVRPVS